MLRVGKTQLADLTVNISKFPMNVIAMSQVNGI